MKSGTTGRKPACHCPSSRPRVSSNDDPFHGFTENELEAPTVLDWLKVPTRLCGKNAIYRSGGRGFYGTHPPTRQPLFLNSIGDLPKFGRS